ncbi:hypothetical protein K7X08_023236 [Anisodus acutangulus]|uniref:Uncharacterized protein n=1 Tax=Anisodus acutangulus TaxID=402998 RepID=A0A9Q1R0W2_9SOLA|nr:hypothetical protein K7X08_023236 [Anisodus acutangulus]
MCGKKEESTVDSQEADPHRHMVIEELPEKPHGEIGSLKKSERYRSQDNLSRTSTRKLFPRETTISEEELEVRCLSDGVNFHDSFEGLNQGSGRQDDGPH